MPHLKYHGRFWRLASDELFFPGIFAIIARVFWSIVMVIILIVSAQRLSRCPDGDGLLSYLFLSLFVFILSIICEAFLVKKSLVGSMVETGKREIGLGKFLTAHILLGFCQFVLAIVGLIVISSHSTIPCVSDFKSYQHYDVILLSVVVITQFVDITSLMCCCYAFSANKEDDSDPLDEHYAATIWEGRCKLLMNMLQICTCNIFGGSNVEEDLNTVARVLTNFFHHDGFLDVVPSDVVAGIILVRIQQRARRLPSYTNLANYSLNASTPSFITPSALATIQDSRTLNLDLEETMDGNEERSFQYTSSFANRAPYVVTTRKDVDRRVPADQALMENIAKYSVYMIAIYTHLLAVYMQPCTGLCCLCCSRFKSQESGRASRNDDFFCGLCKNNKQLFKDAQQRLRSSSSGSCTASPSHLLHEKHSSPIATNVVIKGDNCCGANHAGLSHFTKDIDTEVIYASYDNDTVAKPFAVFLNHDQESVVIAVRGSLSLEDCITDVIADPVEMAIAGETWGYQGKGKYAHGGFLSSALYIREELERSQVLTSVFGNGGGGKGNVPAAATAGGGNGAGGGTGAGGGRGVSSGDVESQGNPLHIPSSSSSSSSSSPSSGINSNSGPNNIRAPLASSHGGNNYPYAHYQLVIVGHSLGAAAAAILALMLRPHYPRLHCYAYGIPGCVLDQRSATESCEYITAVVIDCDWVPRMSLHSVTRLREEILDAISRARVHKLVILQAMFKDFDASAMMYPVGEEPDSEFKRSVTAFKNTMNQRLLASTTASQGGAAATSTAGANGHSPGSGTSGSSSSSNGASSSASASGGIEKARLCLPGRVVHLVKSDQDGFFCLAKAVYNPMHAPSGDFLELMISPTMAWDHFPDRYFVEINRLYDTWR